jgi:hypothetical protein
MRERRRQVVELPPCLLWLNAMPEQVLVAVETQAAHLILEPGLEEFEYWGFPYR